MDYYSLMALLWKAYMGIKNTAGKLSPIEEKKLF
jgi:hypothetical protein